MEAPRRLGRTGWLTLGRGVSRPTGTDVPKIPGNRPGPRLRAGSSSPSSSSPPKYWSRTARNTGSSGAAAANRVIDDRSFCASTGAEDADGIGGVELGQRPGALDQPRPSTGWAR